VNAANQVIQGITKVSPSCIVTADISTLIGWRICRKRAKHADGIDLDSWELVEQWNVNNQPLPSAATMFSPFVTVSLGSLPGGIVAFAKYKYVQSNLAVNVAACSLY
jgi:hypothetical protein